MACSKYRNLNSTPADSCRFSYKYMRIRGMLPEYILSRKELNRYCSVGHSRCSSLSLESVGQYKFDYKYKHKTDKPI